MGEPVGLRGDRGIYHGELRAQRVLWLLLRAGLAEGVLGDGKSAFVSSCYLFIFGLDVCQFLLGDPDSSIKHKVIFSLSCTFILCLCPPPAVFN